MSEAFGEILRGQMSHDDWNAIAPYTGSISPDFQPGAMYAPINYQSAPNAYASVNTDTTGKDGAQRVNADVIRAQYADYERRFQPIENMAIGLLTESGTKDLPLDLARTRQTIGGVFGNVQGQQDRAMERFGQTNKARDITGSNAEAGTMVAGLNTATFADEERRMKLLGGGSTSAASVVRGENSGG